MLQDRQQVILKFTILEHIKTARPVASEGLRRELDFPVSPATIRNEMLHLDEEGYLEQPHTSAGRIPTDKGYRFYVDHLIDVLELTRRDSRRIAGVFSTKDPEEFVKNLVHVVSELSGMFSAAGSFDDELFYETGFSEILEEPEFQDFESIKVFGRLADVMDDEMHRSFERWAPEDEQIFIGDENPWKEAREYAMILSRWSHPQGFSGFLTMMGPKRTEYSRHLAILNRIKELNL